MVTKRYAIAFTGLIAFLLLGMDDCQDQFPDPPFDTTGDYEGTWTGNSMDAEQNVNGCPLTLMLTQNVNADYPGSHAVSGMATIDFSCIELPEWVDEPVPSVVQVNGILGDDGKLGLLTGGCGTGLCVVLGLNGTAEDMDQDGLMDAYAGQWSYQILLAGVEPFGFNGTFDVAIAAAE
jgi:hypothetical protein